MVRKIIKWSLAGLVCLMVVVLVAGRIYQVIAESGDLARYPAPGKLVDVGGHLMHIHCQGKGTPTVVVEQGLGNVSSSWDQIHKQIARTTRVCAYDRVGMGYSEPIAEPVRADEVARLLQRLLQGAGIEDDLVLVGWSAGGVYIREFHRQFPKKVRAMLFVDSSHEQQQFRLPELPGGGGNSVMIIAKYLAPFGLVRLSGIVDGRMEGFEGSDELKSNLVAIYHQSHAIEAMLNESEAFTLDTRGSQPPSPIGDLPLIVLTQGKPVDVTENMPPEMTLEYLQKTRMAWNEMQLELVALSTQGRQIIASESGHGIHADQPDLLIISVVELVQLVRDSQKLSGSESDPDNPA